MHLSRLLPLGLLLLLAGCREAAPLMFLSVGPETCGGDTSVSDISPDAFTRAAPNLSREERRAFAVGDSLFNDNWVEAPASTSGRDGLGPLFNAQSCSSCHFKDGRGRPPIGDENAVGLLLRLSRPIPGPHGGQLPDPIYGHQFQTRAVVKAKPEGTLRIEYETISGQFDDGSTYTLEKPIYHFDDLAYGAMSPDIQHSPRVAPAMIGLGLLAALPESTLEAWADPDDADGDGISGRINYVWDVAEQKTAVGRFGWKANQPTLRQQNAAAFHGDIGITSPLFDMDSVSDQQTVLHDLPNGGSPEISDEKLDRVTLYTATLGVPDRRDWTAVNVLAGETLFHEIGCASCHKPAAITGEFDEIPALAHQEVRAYTDLLLHDMGPELADGRPDFEATGSEWRTPPLWGIGLIETVNKHTRFLHDGRARNLEEAVLWHGGEAQASADEYRALSRDERETLIDFLNTL